MEALIKSLLKEKFPNDVDNIRIPKAEECGLRERLKMPLLYNINSDTICVTFL